MIENERQYKITCEAAEKFERALTAIEQNSDLNSDIHPVLRKAQEDTIRSVLEELSAELREYELRRPSTLIPGRSERQAD